MGSSRQELLLQPLPSLSRIDNDLVCAHMESAWQSYKTTMDPVCAPLASTIKPTWMCQEYLTLLQAYIHDRDKTAINIAVQFEPYVLLSRVFK